jgi:PAS domain S-box-containing protein
MTAKVRVNILGDFSIQDGLNQEVRLPTRKSRALVAYLALHAGKRFTRDHLASLLWSDQSDRLARQSLRQALSAIRAATGATAILCDSGHVAIQKECVCSDVHDFERLTRLKTLDAAEDANALYAGDLLVGHETGQAVFDDWLQVERERLKEIARENLGSILVRRSQDDELNHAVAIANSLIQLDPFDESVHRKLMRLYVRQGRLSAAIRHFNDFTALLRREIGVSPEEKTIALYHELCGERAASPVLDTLKDYAFVLEQMVQCVVVTDLASNIVGWNKAAEAELGFSKDFMYGQKPTLTYAPKRDQSLSDNLFKLACARGHWSGRVKLLSKDGKVRFQNRTVAPLYDRTGTLIGGFGTGLPG